VLLQLHDRFVRARWVGHGQVGSLILELVRLVPATWSIGPWTRRTHAETKALLRRRFEEVKRWAKRGRPRPRRQQDRGALLQAPEATGRGRPRARARGIGRPYPQVVKLRAGQQTRLQTTRRERGKKGHESCRAPGQGVQGVITGACRPRQRL